MHKFTIPTKKEKPTVEPGTTDSKELEMLANKEAVIAPSYPVNRAARRAQGQIRMHPIAWNGHMSTIVFITKAKEQ